MLPVRAVFQKEVFDNFRDRRTLMSALIMGPVFGPILFAFVINLMLEQGLTDVTEPLEVPVIGQEHAPNLIAFLGSHNINAVEGPENRDVAIAAVKTGLHELVIVIPDSFGEDLRSHPAACTGHIAVQPPEGEEDDHHFPGVVVKGA